MAAMIVNGWKRNEKS